MEELIEELSTGAALTGAASSRKARSPAVKMVEKPMTKFNSQLCDVHRGVGLLLYLKVVLTREHCCQSRLDVIAVSDMC